MSARKSAAEVSSAKQKKMAIGGAVLLVGVLVIQGPKMMKLVSGGSASPATPPPAALAPPVTPGVAPTAPTPVSAAPETTGTKFVSFETFGTKDPFASQVNVSGASAKSAGKAAAGGTAAAAPSGKQGTTGTTSSGGAATTSSSTSSGSTKTTFKVAGGSSSGTATATIAVNSKRQAVTVHQDFPSGDPVFTLVSVGSGSASIAIAGGSLKTGGKTFALSVGTPITLLNTATGTKYKLELLSTAPSGT